MSTAALPAAAAAAIPDARRRGAVISPAFDLAFFILPPLGTALFLLGQHAVPRAAFALSALVWVALAQSHFGATLFFFLDPVAVKAYRARPLAYFAVPLTLVAGYAAIGLTPLAGLALLAVPLGSFWHGNRQSAGVAGLYRGLSGSFDPLSRNLEIVAIFAGSTCFTAVGLVRLGMFERFGLVPDRVPAAAATVWWLALAAAFALLAWALVRAFRQCRAASVRPWLRLSILTTSWAMYLPYVLARDVLSAYLAALVPHYLQYHGLVWLVNRNKTAAGALGERSPAAALVRSPARYAAATIGFALALGAVLAATWAAGRSEVGLCVVAGINLAHFWLDGFFWRFRDPIARERTLRFLRWP